MTSVAVVITSYNYERYLAAAIRSALDQTDPPDEVIVVDDGSTDGSRGVIDQFRGQITPVLTSNHGPSSATSTGMGRASSDVVLLLDADDLQLRTRVERVRAVFNEHPDVDWLAHRLGHIDRVTRASLGTESGIITRWSAGRVDVRRAARRGSMSLPVLSPATSGLAFRARAVARLLPIPADVPGQDNYLKFAMRALSPGFCLDEVLALQGLHDSNIYTGGSSAGHTRSRVENAVATAAAFNRTDPALHATADALLGAAVVLGRGEARPSAAVQQRLDEQLRMLPARRRARVAAVVARQRVTGAMRAAARQLGRS